MDESQQVAEATITDEELDLEFELEDTEDVDALKEQLEKEREARRQLTARAKKAEAENKTLKGNTATATQTEKKEITNNALSADDIDMRVLKAQGMSDETLLELKKVAAVTGKSLFDAQSDEIFIAMKTKRESEEKAEKARLGVSRGSGSAKKEKTVSSAGLSDAEHKALWKQQNEQ